jgi:hypothetical protein
MNKGDYPTLHFKHIYNKRTMSLLLFFISVTVAEMIQVRILK